MDFATFALSHLPQPPARVLEVGCGTRGGITRALADAGYDAIGIDPDAPKGEHLRSVSLEELKEEPFDAAVGERVFHHVHPLGPALDKVALGLLDDHAHHCVIGAEDPDERDAKTVELMAAVGRLMRRG